MPSNVTDQDLHDVVDKTPALGVNGFRYDAFHRGKTSEEKLSIFEGERREIRLLHREFKLCCNWLTGCEKRKTLNVDWGSSSMKNAVERWAMRQGIQDNYVSNGAFIAAAIHMGFECVPAFDSPNALFNVSSRSPAILDDQNHEYPTKSMRGKTRPSKR